jgi:hypothetical protein
MVPRTRIELVRPFPGPGFSCHYGFRRRLRVWGLDYALTVAFALGPARLVSTPSSSEAWLGVTSEGFTEFEQFYSQGLPWGTQVALFAFRSPVRLPIPPPRHIILMSSTYIRSGKKTSKVLTLGATISSGLGPRHPRFGAKCPGIDFKVLRDRYNVLKGGLLLTPPASSLDNTDW